MNTGSDTHNPYLANRQAHNDRYTDLAKGKRNWQVIAGGLLLASIVSNVGTVYVAQQQKIVPYIVNVSEDASVSYKELAASSVVDPRAIGLQLADFILKIRRLSTDATLLKQDSDKAFSMCLAPAQNYIRAYYAENPSIETLKHGPVYPRNIIVVPRTERSWTASWDEEQQDTDGNRVGVRRWEALMEIALVLPTNRTEREAAPLGVWVERISWNERS
jgi:type IV secretory pathway TrbF-like protein